MDYITQSPIHCSYGDLNCVLNWTNFPKNKTPRIYF